jgi:hypothetical protein
MRIDRNLHLVIPIYEEDEATGIIAYVHSTPLSEELVDRYHGILGQTYNRIFSGGIGILAGPAHALRILRDLAQEQGMWHDDAKSGRMGVERGLIEEVRRLTMVAALRDHRWESLPLQVAVDQEVLSKQDKSEVENAIVFFIVVSASLNRAQRKQVLEGAAGLWSAQITSSGFTEYLNSLRTSIEIGSSGEKSLAPAKEAPAPANAVVGGKRSSVPV